MSISRQYEVKSYSGKESELPLQLPPGDLFFSEDSEKLFRYGEFKAPKKISGSLRSDNIIEVTQENYLKVLGGQEVSSSSLYYITEVINVGNVGIEVPSGGIFLRGLNFEISGFLSTEDDFNLFTSPIGGSGNIFIDEMLFDISGTNSGVFDIHSLSGFEAVESNKVNFYNCTSLGNIDNYRQGLETNTGRFGGTPTLTLTGTWLGGYRITTSIVRSLDPTMTGPLFKAGIGFEMRSRFLTDLNINLGPFSQLLDFSPSNFINPSTLQIKGAIITREGVSNSLDPNITPNISERDLASDWSDNTGLANTFIGGLLNVSSEVETIIGSVNTPVILQANWISSDLQHFSQIPSNSLRHDGVDPKSFRVTFDFVLRGTQDEQYTINLMRQTTSGPILVYKQTRTIDRLAGLRDVTYFNGVVGVSMEQNEYLFWEVKNITNPNNCFLEIDSQWFVEER